MPGAQAGFVPVGVLGAVETQAGPIELLLGTVPEGQLLAPLAPPWLPAAVPPVAAPLAPAPCWVAVVGVLVLGAGPVSAGGVLEVAGGALGVLAAGPPPLERPTP